MSYVVYVKHFLRAGMASEFDEVFREHHKLLSVRDGFVSLRKLTPATAAGHENEVVVLGEFQTSEHARAWRGSPEHAAIAEGYRRLWVREPVTEFFNSSSSGESSSAER